MILLSDIGGTNSRFSIYQNGKTSPIQIYQNTDFKNFDTLFSGYLNTLKKIPDSAIIGLPGIVDKNKLLSATNVGWHIDTDDIRKKHGIRSITLLNDFALQAYGVPGLKKSDIVRLGGNRAKAHAPRVIIGPGTGLGVCFMDKNGTPLESEIGHATLSPITDEQRRVYDFLKQDFNPPTFDRLLSGKGLVRLYNSLIQSPQPRGKKIVALAPSTPLDILNLAKRRDKIALRAYHLFFEFLGVFASNMALTLKTTGGVYLTGTILQDPFALALLKKSDFRKFFEHKKVYARYLKSIPVFIVTKPHLAFLGLEHLAKQK